MVVGFFSQVSLTLLLQIKYDCVPGFELVGKDTRYCQSDGTWTPSELPTCVPVQCGLPESPSNGKAHYTALAYKSVVTYTCKYGFMAVRLRICFLLKCVSTHLCLQAGGGCHSNLRRRQTMEWSGTEMQGNQLWLSWQVAERVVGRRQDEFG